MNKTVRIILCVLAFAILCAGIVSFLEIFSPAESPILAYVDWSSCEVVSPSGSTRSLDPNVSFQNWNWSPGDTFRLRTTLPPLEDHPDWYGPTSYLLLDCAALQYDVSLDGRPLFTAAFRSIDPFASMCQLHIPLPEEDAGKTLELTFTASDAIAIQMPLVARFSGEDVRSSFSASLACEDALPAGAFALECVLIFAIFFVGLYAGQADWSLPLLAIVAFLNVATHLNSLSGYYFLPSGLYSFLFSDQFPLIPIALLLVFLILNNRRSFWRYLGWTSLICAVVFAACYGIDRMRGGNFASNVDHSIEMLFLGSFRAVLSFLNVYLTAACSLIAACDMVRRTYAVYSRADALALRNQLITEQYQHIRESAEGTSLMRHEWKNQLTSLHVLARKGDPVALERALTRLDSQLAELSPGNYSDNIAVNVLLQNTAARCRHQEIKFTASAMVPADLPVEEADLCSLLLNLVDNALEAASQVEPEKRVVKISLNVNQGYLAVKCENAYKGPLSVDDKGGLLTTKQNRVGAAGMGLAQIRAVTEKYQGMFHFSYTPDWFTANASLRLP